MVVIIYIYSADIGSIWHLEEQLLTCVRFVIGSVPCQISTALLGDFHVFFLVCRGANLDCTPISDKTAFRTSLPIYHSRWWHIATPESTERLKVFLVYFLFSLRGEIAETFVEYKHEKNIFL
jgi:hypothetical protein